MMQRVLAAIAIASIFGIATVPAPALACIMRPRPTEPRQPLEAPIALRVEALETAKLSNVARVRILAVLKGNYKPGQVILLQPTANDCALTGQVILKGSRGTISTDGSTWWGSIEFTGYWEEKNAAWQAMQNSLLPPVNQMPQPRGSFKSWVTTNDYPTRALREKREGKVRFRIHIGTDGRVAGCDILQSSGHADLDDATCRSVIRRARFKPATNSKSEPIPIKWSYSYRWVLPRP